MPINAAFRFEYPKDVTITGITKCTVKVGTTIYTMSSCTVDSGNSYIFVSSIPVSLNSGTPLVIVLS
jgi:hypothetical protein